MTQEQEVIRRVLQGQIECFRFLVERYERPIIRMVRNMTGETEAGEDIAQEVFLAAFRRLSSFDPSCSAFSTWLFTIARNKSINVLRKKRNRLMGELPQITNPRPAGEQLAREEFFARLDGALEALPSAQRRAFVLAEFEQLPYAQVAQIEGTRIGTIRSRIHRARRKLRLVLQEYEGGIV